MNRMLQLSKLSFFVFIATVFIVINIPGIGSQSVMAQSPTTKYNPWKVVDSSLADLLNSGWRLVGQSSHRTATSTTAGGVGAIDDTTYVYTLTKNGKYVTCLLTNPKADIGVYSGCRLIN
jgi:hypothetical protein